MTEEVKKVVLFDIDYTLFNTDLFRDKVYPKLAATLHYKTDEFYEIARKIENELKETQGHFSPQAFVNQLLSSHPNITDKEILNSFFLDETVYAESLFENVEEVLELLEKNAISIGILSTGDTSFQRQKIKHIAEKLSHEKIHIFSDKVTHLPDVLAKYKGSKVYIVDDIPTVLNEAKRIDSEVVTILIKGKKKYERHDTTAFVPDYSINDIYSVTNILLTP